ncbi:C-X-C chemokine receptor type 3-like [Kryptolebias marmoratus]|uniref:Chemokine (C-X-C motif) receptor 3, tandem duplicate 3 n=1 Tax=Kryptolebias marmoratus TaxID=37003 RepID=A0A3Q3AD12_KRYMA|nr:C-X-C chemokine receptor type 3-like [Kryptolebias marmoratus]
MKVIPGGIFNQSYDYDYNDSYDYKDDGGGGGEERRISQIVWLPLFYSVVVIVGLLGNILLLTVLGQKRRSWSTSDTFFLQLGVVDILLLVTLPFWAAQPNQHCGWCSETLFTIFRAVFNINFYMGIFQLVCICLIYYLTTIHADWFSRRRTQFTFVICPLVWLVSLFLTGLDWKLLKPEEDSLQGKTISVFPYSKSGVDWLLGLRLIHLTVGFLLPVALLVILSSRILLRLKPSADGIQKKRPVLVILILMVVFLFCWMPYNIALIADVIFYRSQELLNKSSAQFVDSLKTAFTVTSAVGCINACLRPILYFLLYGKFRERILKLMKCDAAAQHSSLWELDVGETAPCDQTTSEEEQKEML